MNIILLSALVAWFVAQAMKLVICLIKEKRFDFVKLWASGGMPSSHSATVCAMASSCAYLYGFTSPTFAIATIVALVVMYDAAGVRRAVGEQAHLLNQMQDDIFKGNKEEVPKKFKELIGHTPLQVFFGALLGILLGFLFPYLMGVAYAA